MLARLLAWLRGLFGATPALSDGSGSAVGAAGFQMQSVVLYQPDPVMQARVVDLDGLAAWLQTLQAVCADRLARVDTPAHLDIVLFALPDGRTRAWLVPDDLDLPEGFLEALEAVPGPALREGPLAVAILGQLGGAAARAFEGGFTPPIPPAWQPLLGDAPQAIPDDVLAAVWPEALTPPTP